MEESRTDDGLEFGRLPRRDVNRDHAEAHANSYLATSVTGDGSQPPAGEATS